MKATVNLDDRLYRRVRIRAASDGVTITSIFEAALARYLSEVDAEAADRPRFEFPVLAGSGGLVPGVDLNNGAQLQELFDAESSAHQLR